MSGDALIIAMLEAAKQLETARLNAKDFKTLDHCLRCAQQWLNAAVSRAAVETACEEDANAE